MNADDRLFNQRVSNSRDAQIRGVDSDCRPIRPDDALRLRGFWSPFLRCVEVDDLHRPSFNRARSTKSYERAFVNYIFFVTRIMVGGVAKTGNAQPDYCDIACQMKQTF